MARETFAVKASISAKQSLMLEAGYRRVSISIMTFDILKIIPGHLRLEMHNVLS